MSCGFGTHAMERDFSLCLPGKDRFRARRPTKMRVGSVAARQGQDTPTCGTTGVPSLHGPQSGPALEARTREVNTSTPCSTPPHKNSRAGPGESPEPARLLILGGVTPEVSIARRNFLGKTDIHRTSGSLPATSLDAEFPGAEPGIGMFIRRTTDTFSCNPRIYGLRKSGILDHSS